MPGPLRPLLRFARLPAPALATVRRVLDEDDAFRERVLTTLDATGLLSTLDEASQLFLARPDGWSSSLAALSAAAQEEAAAATDSRAEEAASRRLAVLQSAFDRSQASLEAARLELEALRRQVGEERRARRDAMSELGRLRKRVEELEADRSSPPAGTTPVAEELAALRSALAAAEERAERSGAAAAALRDAASAASTGERATPAGVAEAGRRSVDEAVVAVAAAVDAVGALADALGRAAAALAAPDPAPHWPPPEGAAVRGADRRGARGADRQGAGHRPVGRRPPRAPAALPPAVFDDTAAAGDHLLRLPGVLVLVDGYNVTITSRGGLALPAQRRWLLDAAARVSARTGAELEIVFDGAAGATPLDAGRRLGVHVRFTAPDEEADDVLLDLVRRVPEERPVVVVSDDRRVRDGARRLGANVLGVAPLVEVLRG